MRTGTQAQLVRYLFTISRLEEIAHDMPFTGPTPRISIEDGGSIRFYGNNQKADAFEAFGADGWESQAIGMSVNLAKRLPNGVTVVIEQVAQLEPVMP